MKKTSLGYKDIIKTSGRHFATKLIISDQEYRNVMDIKMTSSVNSDNSLTFGNCIASVLECKLIGVREHTLFQGKTCVLYIGLRLSVNTYEWIKMGTFIITESIKEDDIYKLKGYDHFYYTEKGYFTALSGKQTIPAILEEQCRKMEISFVGGADQELIDVADLEGKSIREVLSLLASYCGKNAIMDEDGNLQFRWYEDSNLVIDASRFADPLDLFDSDTEITSLSCAVDKDTTLTIGSGSSISFSNLLMSEARLQVLYERMKSFTYRAGKVDLRLGQPELDVGDIITIEDKRGNRYRIPIMEITYACDGGCYSQIEAKAKTETSEEFSFKGTISQKVDQVHTDLTVTKELLADKVDAFEGKFKLLDADYLQVNKRLSANEGDIELLKSDTVTTNTLQSKLAVINEALITKADITSLNAIDGKFAQLDAKVGNIDTIISRVTTSDSTHSLVLNAQTAVVDEGYFKSLAANCLTVNDLSAGIIDTTKFHLKSADGNLQIADNTIQIKDNHRVRVQIGKDVSGAYGLYQWDEGGNLTWDSQGLTEKGITRPIIVNDMLADDAAIDGKKINISSVVSKINEGSSKIEANHILYDGTSLDIAFGSVKSTVDSVEGNVTKANETIESHSTQLSAQAGKISSLIADQTQTTKDLTVVQGNVVETAGKITQLQSKYNTFEETVDGIKSTVGQHNTEIVNMNGAIKDKAKVFTQQPVPPYQAGDLWVQGSSGFIMRCKRARASGIYTASDWEKADSYTDDTLANQVKADLVTVSNKQTTLERNFDGFKTTVSDTYSTKNEIDDAKEAILKDTNSMITQKAEEITSSVNRLDTKITGNDPDSIESRLEAALTQITDKAIINTVSDEYYKKTETDGKYATQENLETKIKQLKDSVTITLKEMSGFNFLYNSSGWNATSFWTTTGSVTGIRNNDTTDNTVSGSAFYLEKGTMKQEVRLMPGNKYTISCKIKKYISSCSMKVTQNGISENVFSFTSTYTDEKWHSYILPFTCTASTVSIEISSSAKHLTIADIMLNDGEIEKTWTSNNNEIYTSGVKIDKTGLEVTQSNTDTKTIIDASEFAVIYTKTGKKVVRVNKDTTILQKVVAEDDLTVGTVKMIKRENGLDFAIIEE